MSGRVSGEFLHGRHGAVMRATAATAGGQGAVRDARGEERRDQRKADEQQQRDGDKTMHVLKETTVKACWMNCR